MHASASIARNFNAPNAPLVKSFKRLRPLSLLTPEAEIYAQGEAPGTLYRIEFGAVRIYRLLADGRRQVVAFHIAARRLDSKVENPAVSSRSASWPPD